MQWTRLAGRLSLSRAEFRTKSDPRLAQMVHFSAVCVGVDPDSSFKKMLYFKDIFTRCACVRFIKRVCVREYSIFLKLESGSTPTHTAEKCTI
jgi:hypothetical protein